MKLDIPSSLIKTTQLNNFDTLDQTLNYNLEQINHNILPERKIGVMAIVTTTRSGPELRPKAKANKNKYSKPKTSSKEKVPKQKHIQDLT